MSQSDHGLPARASDGPAGPSNGGGSGGPEPGGLGARPGWPTAPPPLRALGAGDPAVAGPYRLEAVLGSGGMGRVYLGRTPAGSAVAVKLVHREYAGDRAFRKRFELEVAAARRVQGLYTVPVVDADLAADEPWLATAYVPGPSLNDAVEDDGPLAVGAAVTLIARVAEALQSIHAVDVIHRDLKPSNIILTPEGPKVIDFGIARATDVTSVTSTGMLAGTPAYMAPEYLRGQAATSAVDVFALGVVACFAATGRPAFGGGSHHGVTYRILEEAPDLDDCPEPLRTVAARCLEKDPQRRPTPAEVIRLCSPVAGHAVPSPTRTPTAVSPAPEPDRPGLHDAPTAASAASAAGTRQAGGGSGRSTGPSPDRGPEQGRNQDRESGTAAGPYPAPGSPPLPLLVGGVGLLALVITLLTVLLPGDSEPDIPSTLGPTATLVDLSHHGGGDGALAFSPDGRTFAASGGGKVQLRDVAHRKLLGTFDQHAVSIMTVPSFPSLAFSPDGKRLAIGTDGGVTGLWDVAGHRQIGETHGKKFEKIRSVAFSPDGKLLATGGDNGLRLWDATGDSKQLRQVAVLKDDMSVQQLAFSPDGRTLATSGHDFFAPDDKLFAVRLWDMRTRKARASMYHDKQVWGVAFSPDGKTLATTDETDVVRLVDTASGRQTDSLNELHGGFRSVAFSPDGKLLAVVTGEDAELWDLASRKVLTTLTDPDLGAENLAQVVFRPGGGKYLGTMAFTGKALLWKLP